MAGRQWLDESLEGVGNAEKAPELEGW